MTTQNSTVEGAVALVTGANRGIGKAFVEELLAAGAARVYAAARNPADLAAAAAKDARIIPVQLDITNEASIQTVAQRATDVTLLVNNAGVGQPTRLLSAADISAARNEMEVNYFGLLHMARAFAPILGANGGGTMVNVLSILSRVTSPVLGSYSASKAAALSLTQVIRAELHRQGTQVIGVMPGYVDTDMTDGIDAPKMQAVDVVQAALDAIRTGQEDVYPGEAATNVAAWLQQDPKAVEREFAQRLIEA